MDPIIARLLIWRGVAEDEAIAAINDALRSWNDGSLDVSETVGILCAQASAILSAAVADGLEGDLWHAYLARLLVLDENPFSLSCEGRGAPGGTLDALARRDAELLMELFNFDFEAVEQQLEYSCLTLLRNWHAGPGARRSSAGEAVGVLCAALEKAGTADEWRDVLAAFYRDRGVGIFALSAAFRLRPDGGAVLEPVLDARSVTFDELVGYEDQKRELRENTAAFTSGRAANNMLLYGDSGTGKSSCVKALLTEFRPRGLRMIEIYKHQFASLASVISSVKHRNYRFIIFIDDLSFEENEVEYKFLKAVIEGGVEARPENVLICATSNRRHLIRETWSDRSDMEFSNELHRSDTVEEKLSLSQRFGVLIHFDSPDRKRFFEIVDALARRGGVELDEQTLHARANAWELRHGGLSGRTARQFVDDLIGRQ